MTLTCKDYVSTLGMPREEWLKRRKNSIGGSDAGAIMGLSKYSSPMVVWGDKTGRLPTQEETEAMWQGTTFEPHVAERFCEKTGKRVRRCNKMLYNPAYPYSHADIDREIIGENAGLECKFMSMPFAESDLENGIYPAAYHIQCLHYMAITGADRWYLAILLAGRGFYWFTIEREQNQKTIDMVMQAEQDFWEQYVISDEPPPPDGTDPTTAAIREMYPAEDEYDTELEDEPLARYEALRKQAGEIKKQMEAIKQEIMLIMQDSTTGVSDSYVVKWKKQERKTYNMKELLKDHPEINIKKYTTTTESRVFSVK